MTLTFAETVRQLLSRFFQPPETESLFFDVKQSPHVEQATKLPSKEDVATRVEHALLEILEADYFTEVGKTVLEATSAFLQEGKYDHWLKLLQDETIGGWVTAVIEAADGDPSSPESAYDSDLTVKPGLEARASAIIAGIQEAVAAQNEVVSRLHAHMKDQLAAPNNRLTTTLATTYSSDLQTLKNSPKLKLALGDSNNIAANTLSSTLRTLGTELKSTFSISEETAQKINQMFIDSDKNFVSLAAQSFVYDFLQSLDQTPNAN